MIVQQYNYAESIISKRQLSGILITVVSQASYDEYVSIIHTSIDRKTAISC